MCVINTLNTNTNTNLHTTYIKVKFVPHKEHNVLPLQRTIRYVVRGNKILS